MAYRDNFVRLCIAVVIFIGAGLYITPRLASDADVRTPEPIVINPPTPYTPPPPPTEKEQTATTTNSAVDSHADSRPPPAEPTPSTPAKSTLLPAEVRSPFQLSSPSDQYRLVLASSGALVLLDTTTQQELFTTNTEYHWPVDWHVELGTDAVLRLSWTHATEEPRRGTPWLSTMLPNCDAAPPSSPPPVLELLDSGLLRIRAGTTTTCTLHRAAGDKGRLAIVYAGFLRTYLETCASHHEKLVQSWGGSGGADVHVFAYHEEVFHPAGEAVTEETVLAHLRACFGASLKTAKLVHVADVHEELPKDGVPAGCPRDKMQRQLDQWKALYLAAQQVRWYMVAEGVAYDYIFKARLDLALWGRVPPLSEVAVPEGGIVAPRVAPDWTWYTMLHDGHLAAGVTDITAYGRPGPMFTWFGLYKEFLTLGSVEKEKGLWKAFNTKGHDKGKVDETCTPESLLAYWLGVNGIPVRTDWRFQMGLLRQGGEVVFTCPTGREWLCPNFIPKANKDGSLAY